MRALVFDVTIPRYALLRAVGPIAPSLYWAGPLSPIALREVRAPSLRGPEWAVVAVEACGMCGSDLGAILFKMSPALTPFSSTPCVLGHEIAGRLVEVGAAARAAGLREGDRVAVDPSFGCAVRGITPPCPACASGHPATCHHMGSTRGGLAPGQCLGFHRDLNGGFAERVAAHLTQIHRLPDAVPDGRAVLAEPLAVATHAALLRAPSGDAPLCVIGGGAIAYLTTAALRRLYGPSLPIAQLVLTPSQAERARACGADHALTVGAGLLDEVCRLTGARRHRPMTAPLGDRDVLTGGFELVFDCVGSEESLRDALTIVRARGAVVMVGALSIVRTDLTWLWSREVALLGAAFYGREPARADRHTFALVVDHLADADAGAALDALITHRLPLARYADAVEANVDRARSGAVKVILTPARL